MKRARRLDSPVLTETFIDVSGGINGGVSDAGALIRHDKNSDNIIYEPDRARSSRDGYRALTALLLPYPPTSTMRYYSSSGTKTFQAAGTKIYLIENGGGFVEQTLPITPSVTGKWSHANLNGMLVCTQEGGGNVPIFYNGTDWLSSALPTPTGAPVFALADGAAGVVDVGEHFWRIRFRFSNGASLACAGIAHTADGSKVMGLSGITPSTRSDYLGFSVERTIVGEIGLWYVVGDSAAKTDVAYTDNTADADLGDLVPAEPGVFGSAPHFDGVIAHADLLFGWTGSNLYVSDAIGADYGTGCLNFHPYYYQVKADDGDPIKLAVQQFDRLVVIKGASMHAFTGFDRDSFSCTQIHGSIGTPSTRGAAADGARVFIYGGRSRIFVLDGQTVRGLGSPQVTHYLDKIALTGENMVEVINYRGDKILFGYPSASSSTNNEALAFSMLGRNWEHYTGIRICGSLCPKNDTEFGGATMVYGDPKLYEAAVAMNPMRWAANGVVVCNAADTQWLRDLASDGLGGAIIAWTDHRSGYYNIYVQRIDSMGSPLWGTNGIPLSVSVVGGQDYAAILSDGAGGAIVVWQDSRGGTTDLYAQRLNASGVAQWAVGGVVVSNATAQQQSPALVSDGAGGAIVVWQDTRASIYSDLYAQRISAAGAVQWTANGVAICVSAGTQDVHTVVSDGAGGAIVVWQDSRSGTHPYAQRIVAAGTVAWTANGVVLCAAAGNQSYPKAVSDGAGGVIATWWDARTGVSDIYAQRLNASGVAQWTANGVVVCNDATTQSTPIIVADGAGGAVITWNDGRGGTNTSIYSQRINSLGAVQWAANGIVVCSVPATTRAHQVSVPDGAGGVIVVWDDNRAGNYDLYAQWVSGVGVVQWADNGIVVCSASATQNYPFIAYNGLAGCFVAWLDYRSTTDLYAQRIDTSKSSIIPGYHVWSLFDGETDEAAFDGSGGTPIPIMFETPEYDAGEPDVMKSFDRLQMYTKQGKATFSARLTTELGSANVSFAVEQVTTTWAAGSTDPVVAPVRTATSLVWNTGKWAGTKPGEATTGIPPGTLGKRCKLMVRADVSEKVVLVGHALDFQLLPERPYV
jgi:hypothetical protein